MSLLLNLSILINVYLFFSICLTKPPNLSWPKILVMCLRGWHISDLRIWWMIYWLCWFVQDIDEYCRRNNISEFTEVRTNITTPTIESNHHIPPITNGSQTNGTGESQVHFSSSELSQTNLQNIVWELKVMNVFVKKKGCNKNSNINSIYNFQER